VGNFCDSDLLRDAVTFWSDKKLPGLTRRLAQAREEAEQCIALKQREHDRVAAWLRKLHAGP
jgi:prephenate dehydrogenase